MQRDANDGTPELGEFGEGTFTVRIDLGNDSMVSSDAVYEALSVVGAKVRRGESEGPISDGNGNTVGRFEIDSPGLRRPILTHDAYRILCGLVHRGDQADPAEAVGPGEAWDLLRHLFPLGDARLSSDDDGGQS